MLTEGLVQEILGNLGDKLVIEEYDAKPTNSFMWKARTNSDRDFIVNGGFKSRIDAFLDYLEYSVSAVEYLNWHSPDEEE